ncbi:MAG: hypothetical protein ER33_05805 [Cyanobium sp. CACIAM 14]|nr:MAG: hypothetical protein ER33_05805 [Cyanobium sp. CACIAM 14]
MIASSPSAPVAWKAERSARPKAGAPMMPEPDARQRLLLQAATCHERARKAAHDGDLEASARAILEGLDCERRAGGLGPQVLQLIKPRS